MRSEPAYILKSGPTAAAAAGVQSDQVKSHLCQVSEGPLALTLSHLHGSHACEHPGFHSAQAGAAAKYLKRSRDFMKNFSSRLFKPVVILKWHARTKNERE